MTKNKEEEFTVLMKSEDIKEMKIINENLDEIGEIEDIVIDYNHGVLAYVTASIKESLNGEFHIIPWKCFKFNPIENAFELKVEMDKLKNAPSFNKGKWPDFKRQKWHTEIHTYYAITPYWRVQGEYTG